MPFVNWHQKDFPGNWAVTIKTVGRNGDIRESLPSYCKTFKNITNYKNFQSCKVKVPFLPSCRLQLALESSESEQKQKSISQGYHMTHDAAGSCALYPGGRKNYRSFLATNSAMSSLKTKDINLAGDRAFRFQSPLRERLSLKVQEREFY